VVLLLLIKRFSSKDPLSPLPLCSLLLLALLLLFVLSLYFDLILWNENLLSSHEPVRE
jgi:hypothetical protein